MSDDARDTTRRDMLAYAVAAAGLASVVADPVHAQQGELTDEEKKLAPYLLLTGAGATISIDASQFDTRSLLLLAGSGADKGARLILRNAGAKSVRDLLLIAGPNVTLEI